MKTKVNFNSRFKNIIVVGGNAAGPAAAAKAKRVDPSANVLMFESGNYISTGTCELPYVLGGVIDDYNKIIFYSPEEFESEKGVKVFINHRVDRIDRINKRILVHDLIKNCSVEYPYDKLILSTGSKAKRIDSLTPNLKNVFTLKSVKDLLAIQRYLSNLKLKKILITGAGYIGLEVCEALIKRNIETIILEKEKMPLPSADPEIQNLISEGLNEKNVKFYGGISNPKFHFDDDYLKSIKIDGWQIEFDAAIQAIGVEPNITLAIAAKLELGKHGIKVDQNLRTSDQNIFAAGDCIEVANYFNRRPMYLPLATLARDYGYIAGENAAGGFKSVSRVIPNVAVKIFDKNFVKVGLSSIEADDQNMNYDSVSAITSNLVKIMPGAQNTFGKVIFERGTGKILGAQFFGGNEVIGYGDLISLVIKNNGSVKSLAEINFNYTPPKSPFINLLSILGKKSKGKHE